MSKKIQLTIAEPCHENWDGMTPVEQGKFCGSCQKQVVDFSEMSDRQMVEFFKKPTTGSVCGRFMTDQLDRPIEIPRKRIPWIKYFFQIALPALFISKASAQIPKRMGLVARPPMRDTTKTVVVPERRLMGEIAPVCILPEDKKVDIIGKPVMNEAIIKGKVVNEKGEAVPFASIQTGIKGKGVMADENGLFNIHEKALARDRKLTVSATSFESKEIVIDKIQDQLVIQLKANVVLDEVVVVDYGRTRKGRYTLGGASWVSVKVEDAIVEIPQKSEENKMLVYPNPTSAGGNVTISFAALAEGYYSMQILTVAGQLVQQKEIWIDAEARLFTINVPVVAAGNYFIALTNKKTGKRLTEKFIIQ